MPQPDPNAPESIILGQFSGIKNTVSRERLSPQELETATNIDIDDTGQVRRRRGYTLTLPGEWHSIYGPVGGKTYGVCNGELGIIRSDPSFFPLGVSVGRPPVCYAKVDEETYFSSPDASGVIHLDETVSPWGHTGGQGFWDSPVYTPTDTLGQVGGRLLGDPPLATAIEAFHGRIYLASGKTLWKTELYRFHYVDRIAGFYQFEHDITMLRSVDDGIYVGTEEGLYFLQEERLLMREFKSLKLIRILDVGVLQGSDVVVPIDLVHPGGMQQPTPTGTAVVFLTNDGITAGFNSGECYNLTQGRVALPHGVSAAGLFRQDQGLNSYVAVVDSQGSPTANAKIGDHIDAEIIRAVDQ